MFGYFMLWPNNAAGPILIVRPSGPTRGTRLSPVRV